MKALNTPRTKNYRVKKGDSLWKIATDQYHDGKAWPFIAKANALKRPELILAGQALILPDLKPQVTPVVPLNAPVWKPAPMVAYPAFEFDLAQLLVKPLEIQTPAGTASLKLTGTLKIQKKGTVESFTVSDMQKISVNAKQEYSQTLNTLTKNIEVSIDLKKRKLDLSGSLVSELKLPGGGKFTHSLTIKGKKLIFTAKPTPVTGNYRGLAIEGTFGYEISFEPKDNFGQRETVTVPAVGIASEQIYKFTFYVLVTAVVLVLVAVILSLALPTLELAGGVVAFLVAYRSLREAGASLPQL